MPLVSIVMPAHNSERTIVTAVDSVLNQSFKDIELIICDDCSDDDTPNILAKYKDIDPRVIVIRNDFSEGAARARNNCLCIASSRYVAFLDSDDYWEGNKIELQLEFMLKNNVAISHGEYKMFDESGGCKVIRPSSKITYSDLLRACNIGCLTVMIDTETVGVGSFPIVPKEDYALWLTILKKGHSSFLYPGCLANYRKQNVSLSSSKIREIKKQWYVLKHVARISFLFRVFYITTYFCNGFLKHYLLR